RHKADPAFRRPKSDRQYEFAEVLQAGHSAAAAHSRQQPLDSHFLLRWQLRRQARPVVGVKTEHLYRSAKPGTPANLLGPERQTAQATHDALGRMHAARTANVCKKYAPLER